MKVPSCVPARLHAATSPSLIHCRVSYAPLNTHPDGGCLLINLPKRVQLCHFNFKKPVRDAKFSPDSQYIAVTHGRHLQVRPIFLSD